MILEAISDWHIQKISLEEWMNKWGVNKMNKEIYAQILMQYNWCLNNDFNYTPVKIINSSILPEGYEINELHYFLNDFNEESLKAISELVY